TRPAVPSPPPAPRARRTHATLAGALARLFQVPATGDRAPIPPTHAMRHGPPDPRSRGSGEQVIAGSSTSSKYSHLTGLVGAVLWSVRPAAARRLFRRARRRSPRGRW